MENLVIIGASGFVGEAITREALKRGHQVTAIVRHPEKINIKDPDLAVVKGDVSSIDEIARLCKDASAVISAYNPGWNNPNIYQDILENYPKILEGVKKAGVKRILIVGGAGSLFVKPGVMLMDSEKIPQNILPGVKSLGEFYLNTLEREHNIDWVFFSPAGKLEHGERTDHFRLGKDELIVDKNGESHISVEDYAVAMLNELERPQHHFERFTIGY